MARAELRSLRLSRSDTERLLAALVISLLLHVTVWGGYEVGKKFGWWQAWHLPAWLHKTARKNPPPPQLQIQPEVQPEIFVDVTQSDPEPPKKTIYYSDKNSHAANPDEDKNLNQPKLDGKQKEVPKTEDANKFSKSQPTPPQQQLQPSPPAEPAEAAQPVSPFNQGDVKLTKVADKKTEEQKPSPPQQQPRPRTINAALAQQHLPGRMSQQNGGAHRKLDPSFDVKATPFGDYDRAFIEAVQQRWSDLLDSQRFAQDRTGKVVVRFKLEYDGTVHDMEVLENTVGDLLGYVCQAAISEAAPFGKWPDDMRRMIGANFREITFTFYYY
jgi:hypothetical protein